MRRGRGRRARGRVLARGAQLTVIVFEATLHGTPRTTTEATEVKAFAPDEIPWDELAFETDAAAVRDLLGA